MFKRILVPLDGTPESNIALPVARTLSRATGASLVLVRVVPSSASPGDLAGVKEAEQTLRRISDELVGAGLKVDVLVRRGDPAEEILRVAHVLRPDLILMRTHGRVGIERALLGSVTERVVSDGVAPTLLVRPGGRRISEIRSILAPVDGSAGAAIAMATAVGLATTTGAAVKLIEVAVPVPLGAWDGYAAMTYYDPKWDEEALASANAYVEAMVTRLRNSGITADGETRMRADIAGAIVEAAEDASADLIVMSTAALTGVARVLLGSVADAVARTAHCPVLLVHRPAETSSEATETQTLVGAVST